MRYRRLGRTALDVSVLGFGGSPLGDVFGTIDPGEGQRVVDAALDGGINFFDVAPYYGLTLAETRLGAYLQGKRHRAVLATKAGRYGRDLPDGFDFSAARITRSVEESLRRLQTDVIDLYQVHDVEFGDRQQLLHETIPAMQRLKEQGKVRYIGITGYVLDLLGDLAEAAEVDTVLSYCHLDLLDTTMARVLAPVARQRGLGLINASPLHMGLLTPQGGPAWHPAPPRVRAAAREAARWCEDRGVDLPALALQFALGQEAAATTLVGVRTAAEVEQNLRAAAAVPDPDILAQVQALLASAADVSWPSGRPEYQPGSPSAD